MIIRILNGTSVVAEITCNVEPSIVPVNAVVARYVRDPDAPEVDHELVTLRLK